MGFWEKMLAIDRRWIFLFVGVSLLVPMIMSLFMNVGINLSISSEVQGLYDAMASLPPGSKVLMSFDYDPPSAPEVQPMADAAVKFCFARGLKIAHQRSWFP